MKEKWCKSFCWSGAWPDREVDLWIHSSYLCNQFIMGKEIVTCRRDRIAEVNPINSIRQCNLSDWSSTFPSGVVYWNRIFHTWFCAWLLEFKLLLHFYLLVVTWFFSYFAKLTTRRGKEEMKKVESIFGGNCTKLTESHLTCIVYTGPTISFRYKSQVTRRIGNHISNALASSKLSSVTIKFINFQSWHRDLVWVVQDDQLNFRVKLLFWIFCS